MILTEVAPLQPVAARSRLIVGLDVASLAEAQRLVARLADSVEFYKIGLELISAGGLAYAGDLIGAGKKVFIDLKMHDIPNTVSRAAAQIADLGASFLTVHAYPQTMRAAQEAVAGSGLTILGVSVLTSADDADLAEAGYRMPVRELVALRARQALGAGIGGLVASAEEAASIRAIVGARLVLVTPGIRPAGSEAGDQKRVVTPSSALKAGSDYLVVSRPIIHAADPAAMARAIVEDMSRAL